MKVEAAGEGGVLLMEQLGAAPVTIEPGEVYSSLERGLVEAQITHWAFLDGFKTAELCKYHTLFGDGEGGLYQPCMGYIINLNTWNQLTPAAQKILEDVYYNAAIQTIVLNAPKIAGVKKLSQDRGDVIVHLTNEERAAWETYMDPVIEKWIKECEAKGLPGKRVYDEFMQIISKKNASKQ